MSAYNIIVNDVEKTKSKILCLARIDNYRNVLKHVSIGQSIRSDPFQLDYYDSIGTSSWMLLFFPNGQYIESSNSVVMGSGRASMYLKMVDCEHQSESLTMTVKFFIKSPYCDVLDKFSSVKNANFSYCNRNERWSGPYDLAAMQELYSNSCKNLFLNDSLTVGCELDDTTFSCISSPSPMMRLNENIRSTDTSYTDGGRSLTDGWKSDDTAYTQPSYTDALRYLTVGFQLGHTAFRSSNPPPTIPSKENVHSTGRSYSDVLVESQSKLAEDHHPRKQLAPLQAKENQNVPSRSYTAGRHSLPAKYESDQTTFGRSSLHLGIQSKENRDTAVRSSKDTKLENVTKPTNIGSQLNEASTTQHQNVSQINFKIKARRATTFNPDAKVDKFKEKKNQKRVPVRELTSACRSDSFKENENKQDSCKVIEKDQFCACRNQHEMISKETQTWDEKLRLCSQKADKDGAVHQLTSPYV